MKKLKKWIFEKYFKAEFENCLLIQESIIKQQKTHIKNLKERLNYYNNKGVI